MADRRNTKHSDPIQVLWHAASTLPLHCCSANTAGRYLDPGVHRRVLGVGQLRDDALVHEPVGAAGGALRQKVDVDPRVLAPVAVVVAAADHLAHQKAVRREEGLDPLPGAPRGPVLDVQVDLRGRASRRRLPAVRLWLCAGCYTLPKRLCLVQYKGCSAWRRQLFPTATEICEPCGCFLPSAQTVQGCEICFSRESKSWRALLGALLKGRGGFVAAEGTPKILISF